MTTRPSIREVLGPEADDRVRVALAALEGQRTPWYLRLLIGIGAWAGAGFLLSFVLGMIAMALGGQSAGVAVVLGALTIGAAILLRHKVTGLFGSQIALVCAFAGQLMLIYGVGDSLHSEVAASVAALVVSAVLIAAFPDRVQRFCSTIVAAGAVLFLVVIEGRVPYGTDAIALSLALLPLVLWRVAPRAAIEGASEIVEPVVYGLAVSLFLVLLIDTIAPALGASPREWWGIQWPATVGLAIMAIWLVAAVGAEHRLPWHKPEAVILELGLILFGALTWRTPAIMATLLMLILGFDRRARGLVVIATLFFLFFGGFYYYDLHLTLLQKSGILMLSGALCLAGAGFVRWRFPQEVA